MNEKIALTGATGAVGRRLATRLSAADVRLRLVVRDVARAPRLDGVEVRQAAGYGAYEAMRAALTECDALFLIPAAETPDRVNQHRAAVDAAVAAGVGHIVYLSFFGASVDATFTLARDHWHTEQYIRGSGAAWTFLRMNLYADFLPTMVRPDGAIRGPAGDGRLAAVLRDDVAAAGAAVLTSDGHEGRTYDLTGPENLTLAEVADTMARLTRKAVRFEDESDDEAFRSRGALGAPDREVLGWVSSYWAIRDGSLEQVSSHVEQLTGAAPTSLEAYIAAHPEALNHVDVR